MTINSVDRNPIYVINGYVMALLKQEIDIKKIKDKLPISTSDNPEFKDSGKPYLIYGFGEDRDTGASPIHTCTGTYSVYGKYVKDVNDIIQLLTMALSDDNACINILRWANGPFNSNNALKGINLASVEVAGSQSAMPPVEEGGLVDGYIIIKYRYTSQDKDFSITS